MSHRFPSCIRGLPWRRSDVPGRSSEGRGLNRSVTGKSGLRTLRLLDLFVELEKQLLTYMINLFYVYSV